MTGKDTQAEGRVPQAEGEKIKQLVFFSLKKTMSFLLFLRALWLLSRVRESEFRRHDRWNTGIGAHPPTLFCFALCYVV